MLQQERIECAAGSLKYLDRYLSLGGGRFADAIAYHFYVPNDPPEAMLANIAHVREIMKRDGQDEKPLWNTETGWLIPNSDGSYGVEENASWKKWSKLTDSQSTTFVSRALIISLQGWVREIFLVCMGQRRDAPCGAERTRPKGGREGISIDV